MIQTSPNLSVDLVGEIVRNAVAPVFLLSGIGAFLNVCTSRLSRIVDRSRDIEPRLLGSRGREHDRWVGELKILDRRMSLVSWAIFLSVLSAILVCIVVSLLFAASLTNRHYGTAIAWLFIGAMLSIAAGFMVFLLETWVGSRAVRVRSELLQHTADETE
jgi:hypothetical protein